jgi:hypothetical protein
MDCALPIFTLVFQEGLRAFSEVSRPRPADTRLLMCVRKIDHAHLTETPPDMEEPSKALVSSQQESAAASLAQRRMVWKSACTSYRASIKMIHIWFEHPPPGGPLLFFPGDAVNLPSFLFWIFYWTRNLLEFGIPGSIRKSTNTPEKKTCVYWSLCFDPYIGENTLQGLEL